MKDGEMRYIFAREGKSLSPWGAWARENGLFAKRERLSKHKQIVRHNLAYRFRLTIFGFEKVENGDELFNQLNNEFDWENKYVGFVKESVNREVREHVFRKGVWPQKRQ